MKILSLLLSMVNSVISSLILLSCASKHYLQWDALGQIGGRLLTAALVLLISILTFWDGVQPVRPEKLLLAGLLLILLGASSAIVGVHLSFTSGDLKKVFIIYGGSLFVQGISSIGGVFETQDTSAA